MLNLSELFRQESGTFYKFLHIFNPDIYLVESVSDFQESKINLPELWCKKFLINRHGSDGLFILKNVGINYLDKASKEKGDFFEVHDGTGSCVMFWGRKNSLFDSGTYYQEMVENAGLRKKDFIYELYFGYIKEKDLPFIIKVNKNELTTIIEDKEINIFLKLKGFIPKDLEPAYSQ
ncbi:MAG: hypothetical protein Q7S56_01230 [Nanoarchaeota archaeon]|nr:hypothetical protein [Nanoarchaeota archaeon]